MPRSHLALLLSLLLPTLASAAAVGVKMTELPDRVRVEINGELFTEYVFSPKVHPWTSTNKDGAIATNWPRHVYFYPVLGPGGLPMTRNWPMKEASGEERDHVHHRSLWVSHISVNGEDCWGEGAKSGSIVHDKFLEVKSGAESGVIRSSHQWLARDGRVLCTDEQTFRVYNRPKNERLFDYEITLSSGDKDVVFGDDKDGFMGIRLNETMRLQRAKEAGEKKAKTGDGHIVLSTGIRDLDTWGKRAEWCDYHGPVEGKILGVAIFDHPKNPQHPTWWHVREYGLFAANPFGVHYFEKKPEGAGDLTIPAGKSVTFKYRFYLHEGDEKQAKVAARYKDYAVGK